MVASVAWALGVLLDGRRRRRGLGLGVADVVVVETLAVATHVGAAVSIRRAGDGAIAVRRRRMDRCRTEKCDQRG